MYFEQIQLHSPTCSIDRFAVTEHAIIEFATQWDPMPFHIDPEFAKTTPFGSVIAPGLFGLGVAVRLSQGMTNETPKVIAGLGWQDIKFHAPIVPGDLLHLETVVANKRDSASRPEAGIVENQLVVTRADGAPTTSLKIMALVQKQPG